MQCLNMQKADECRYHYYPLSWAAHRSFRTAQGTGGSDVEKGRAPIVIHVSNIHQMNSEVSYFLPATPIASTQLWKSHQGVLIRGDASPGLWSTSTGEQLSYIERMGQKVESGGKKAERAQGPGQSSRRIDVRSGFGETLWRYAS